MELEAWFDKLSNLPNTPNVHNLFSRQDQAGLIRLGNLKQYFTHMLAHKPRTLLVGEAPGYQGTYRTGVPFCSEAIMLGPKNKFGLFGGPENGYRRVYVDSRIWKEPSATIVQRTIDELNTPPLVWATFPLHPHRLGTDLSNRAPSAAEIQLGSKLLNNLLTIMQPERVIAVGTPVGGDKPKSVLNQKPLLVPRRAK